MAGPEEYTKAAPPPEPDTEETPVADAEQAPAAEAPAETAAEAPAEPAAEAPAEPSPAGEGAAADGPDYLALAQRTQADFENYRRRMTREVASSVDRGVAKLAKELLPALDHLEIALKGAEGHEEVVRGFALVRDEFVNALAKVGIQPFAPKGEPFDPNEHEAMASQPAEDAEPGTVIEVYQQGYRLNGAVLRPARVIVAQ